ncbi:MAG: polymer-forming cytoskeletal protein [Kiritimatiellales bacterium]|nr:polymer-forming cytoskeletal protein [Kiritimatiellales bacterium]
MFSRYAKFILPVWLLVSSQVMALEFAAPDSFSLPEDKTISNELWLATGAADIRGTVQDDLFVMAGTNLLFNGTFEGNVWGLGSGVILSGHAGRNVRLAGQTVQVDGQVGGNVLACATTVKINPGADIKGSLGLLGQTVIVEGVAGGNVSILAQRVTLSAQIGGDVRITSSEIVVQPNTVIHGDLVYTSARELVLPEGIVEGSLVRKAEPAQKGTPLTAGNLISHFVWYVAAVFAGLPFLALFPLTSALASQTARKSPWRCLWVGALASIVLPVFGFMCIFSIIGLPLGCLMLAFWGMLVYVSRIIVGLVLGAIMLRRKNNSFLQILMTLSAGLFVIYVGLALPVINISVFLMVTWIGMGALLIGLFQKKQLVFQIPQQLRNLAESKAQEEAKENEEELS